MHDVIIVGAGLFGSIIARHLRELGKEVVVVDDERPDSGSRPAGCVIRPSWVSSMSKSDLSSGLELLDKYYGLHEGQFRVAGTPKKVTCYRVEPTDALNAGSKYTGKVDAIETPWAFPSLVFERGPAITLQARHVIVAAGLWTPLLCPWVATWGRWGWSFRGPYVEEPVISVWAPYRQVLAFNMRDGRSWSGDGSALIEKSASEAAEEKAMARCRKVVGFGHMIAQRGVRPYAETKGAPCLISRMGSVWAVTGGAKNGTIAAAWAAQRVAEEMGL